MLKVLVLSDYFLPHVTGGVERAAFEVSRRIASIGHDVTVLTFLRDGAMAEEEMDGIHVVRVPAVDVSNLVGIQLSASLHVWPALRRLFREKRFDLVHTHGLFFHVSLAAAVLARTSGLPLVTTAHVGSLASIEGMASRLSAAYEQSIGRLILKSSREVIAVSHAVAEHMSNLGAAADKLTVIPNGVDVARYAPPPASRRGRRPPRAIFVGRLIANKGPQHVIEALPRVISSVPGAECWFVGDGPMRSELERAVREKGLERSVRFLGEREDVADLLNQSDVFVRPSLSEGMPLAVLEAMAARLPVVVTPVGGTAELVEDGRSGFLVPPRDQLALEDRLRQLLSNSRLRRAMGTRGSRLAATYDWDTVSQKTLDIYDRALKQEQRELAHRRAA